MSVEYKKTVILPKTDFPMRAGLPKMEPTLLEQWKDEDLYGKIRGISADREMFVLHDGPPYANGHLHIGHALNKILKDVITRSQQMLGKNAVYVPGWDCHGLPIEWKIEEQYRAKGKNKDDVPIAEFRKECREFAQKWLDIQREEFKRLGVMGDWDNPYVTMDYKAEASIARELGKFLMNGSLYMGSKPVMWSVVEKTALAEAEVEYHDHTSKTIYVRFPVTETKVDLLKDATIVIWTTTPWTIPGNRAISYGEDIEYSVIEVTETAEEAWSKVGEKMAVCTDLLEDLCKNGRITAHKVVGTFKGSELEGTLSAHPFRGQGYDFDVPLLAADYVTTDTGTGFVHTAPTHGPDDYQTGLKYGLEVPEMVDGDGAYYQTVPLFAGERIYDENGKEAGANEAVIAKLVEVDALLSRGRLKHSYPCSWRSKAPVIYRTTPQWFISMQDNDLREKALKAIDETRFVPEAGRNRLHSMIANRPDWCVSRQRAWGVPITVFIEKSTRQPLRDQEVLDRVYEAFCEEGADAWFTRDAQYFLGDKYNADDFEQVTDVLDVWFDSGSTHAFVLEERQDLKWPADLYLEGSDQHRGWFHSSLLESCGTRGRAPYEAVLTHGFVLDGEGRKMSKSLGNVIAPNDVINKLGADILRLWVVSSDYHDDLRISHEIIQRHSDIYRRLRNTLRFLLGNLAEFSEDEKVADNELPELERWVLHRLSHLDDMVRKTTADYDFHSMFIELHNFCALDMSAFYLDIRKDALYCDAPSSLRRRAARTVMDRVFDCLVRWLAPVLCFTADEAWRARYGAESSVHAETFNTVSDGWKDDALATKWAKIRKLRRVVTGALELERAEKRIGASLDAAPKVYAAAEYVEALNGLNLAEIAITSDIELITGDAPEGAYTLEDVAGVGVVPALAEGAKCERCWQTLPEVGSHAEHKTVCNRCADAVDEMGIAAE
ncbi:isoleucine--tRNA ligase [Thalassospira sp. HF15]|uniref:isoleucine--tRNA ligase n=1 Tax=Thalassospira sp. HF15 TaxID=2722755 RepID=UPI00142F71E9|nr:isoleucine--tRNA ligase [Thalassospira sp. HF15]NIY75490.1 isoleucine--tRNA ligase [Thalassospira sp. HF15]